MVYSSQGEASNGAWNYVRAQAYERPLALRQLNRTALGLPPFTVTISREAGIEAAAIARRC